MMVSLCNKAMMDRYTLMLWGDYCDSMTRSKSASMTLCTNTMRVGVGGVYFDAIGRLCYNALMMWKARITSNEHVQSSLIYRENSHCVTSRVRNKYAISFIVDICK